MKEIRKYSNQVVKRAYEKRAELEREEAYEKVTQARLPKATLDQLTITHPLVQGAIDMTRAWADRVRRGERNTSMVLVGPYGTGKTHIATAVLWSITFKVDEQEVGYLGKFYKSTDLILKMNPHTSEFGTTVVANPENFIGDVPIVVIDDVGAEQAIPYISDQEGEMQARYYRVIDYCYRWHISLVVTSNLSLKQLEDHLGGRCWDRLNEMAPKGFMFDLTGVPSWREKTSGRVGGE